MVIKEIVAEATAVQLLVTSCTGCEATVGWVEQRSKDGPLWFSPAPGIQTESPAGVRLKSILLDREGVVVYHCGSSFRVRGTRRVPGDGGSRF